jgi:GNAT superfamily N-acetyltransferase
MSATSGDPPVIRDARPEDLPRVLELLLQLSEQSTHPEARTRPLTADQPAALRSLTEGGHRLLVLEVEGRLLGTLTLYILPNISHGGRPAAIVENVVVDAAMRGSGLGHALMAEAERLAATAGAYKVALTSNNQRTAAHAFYRGLGYDQSHQGFTKYRAEG